MLSIVSCVYGPQKPPKITVSSFFGSSKPVEEEETIDSFRRRRTQEEIKRFHKEVHRIPQIIAVRKECLGLFPSSIVVYAYKVRVLVHGLLWEEERRKTIPVISIDSYILKILRCGIKKELEEADLLLLFDDDYTEIRPCKEFAVVSLTNGEVKLMHPNGRFE